MTNEEIIKEIIKGIPKIIYFPVNDKDPACVNYLSQIYRQTKKRHLFKDSRKETKK